MTNNDIILISFLVALVLIFFSLIGLIVFFAIKNNTKIALNVDYYMCLTCFILILYSFLNLMINPYDHSYESAGLPGDYGGQDMLVLSYKIYLSIVVALLFFPYCLIVNKSLSNIKTRLRAKFKLFLLVFLVTQIILIKRQRNIIDKMDYSEFEQHFKEMGYSRP